MAKSNSFSSQPLKMEQSLPWDKIEHKNGPKNILLAILLNWNIITFRENNAYKSHGFYAEGIFHRKKEEEGKKKRKGIDVEKKYSKCEIYLLDIKETSVRGFPVIVLTAKGTLLRPPGLFWTFIQCYRKGLSCSESTEWLSLTLTIFSSADARWLFYQVNYVILFSLFDDLAILTENKMSICKCNCQASCVSNMNW